MAWVGSPRLLCQGLLQGWMIIILFLVTACGALGKSLSRVLNATEQPLSCNKRRKRDFPKSFCRQLSQCYLQISKISVTVMIRIHRFMSCGLTSSALGWKGEARKTCSPWHSGAGLALTARPWCSPVEHAQFHRFPTSDKATLWLMDQHKN